MHPEEGEEDWGLFEIFLWLFFRETAENQKTNREYPLLRVCE
jgi:hypothetical protein